MPRDAPKIRLFVEAPLGAGAPVELAPEQAHYLVNVMRLRAGDEALLFNGRDGEWRARLAEAGRRAARMECLERTREQTEPPDLWLLFAPLKKTRTDFVAEKAAELGARRVLPVITRHTNSERVNAARLRANAVEAAEQCGILSVPEVAEPAKLFDALSGWDPARALHFCDETMVGAAPAFAEAAPPPAAVLIGPEGGFAPEEAERLRRLPFARPVSLGPRVLRAETAAVAALTLWQARAGDWR